MSHHIVRAFVLIVILSLGAMAQAQETIGQESKPIETPLATVSSDTPPLPAPAWASDRSSMDPLWSTPTDTEPITATKDGSFSALLGLEPLAVGGPDNYGYRFADNVSATSCNTTFTDISGTGTALSLTDDGEDNVSMPFYFDFYDLGPGGGATSTPLRIGNNGGILFNATSGDVWASNEALPTSSIGASILPFWDDLSAGSGGVRYQTLGTAPNRRFIVQWTRPHYSVGGSNTVNFQVVFYEGTLGIDFVYQDVDFGNPSYNGGASATVGIQRDASNYLQYSYNSNSLAAERAICFRNPRAGGETCSQAATTPFAQNSCPGSVSWQGFPRMDVSGALGTAGGYGGPAASCWLDSTAHNDVWFQWTNQTGAPVYVRVSTDMLVNGNASNGDSQIGVWSGCSSGSGTGQLFCSDDGGDVGNTYLAPSNAATNIAVANGATIYMQFDGWYSNTAFDTFVFACAPQASISAPPSNDACTSATGVIGPSYNNGGLNMSGATVAVNDPRASCMFNSGERRGGATVWYKYTPATNGTVTATCKGASVTDCVIAAYTGACGSLAEVSGACSENTGNGGLESISFNGVGGTTYYFMVTTFSIGFALDDVTFTLEGPLAVTLAEFYAQQVGDHVLLTWETNSELNNRGFNLYRGTSPAGPDRQLNETLIPSQAQGSPGGFLYTWEDHEELVPGTTYYYWLEDVDLNGVATRHGPVSVDFVAPTAVTLNSVQANPGLDMLHYSTAAALPALSWLAVVAGAGVALALGRRRTAE